MNMWLLYGFVSLYSCCFPAKHQDFVAYAIVYNFKRNLPCHGTILRLACDLHFAQDILDIIIIQIYVIILKEIVKIPLRLSIFHTMMA